MHPAPRFSYCTNDPDDHALSKSIDGEVEMIDGWTLSVSRYYFAHLQTILVYPSPSLAIYDYRRVGALGIIVRWVGVCDGAEAPGWE